MVVPVTLGALITFGAPAPAVADAVRVERGAMLALGAGGLGVCLLSDSGTRDDPCQYAAGVELTYRPGALPLRLLGGARSSRYTNDYPDDSSTVYYSTHGIEGWVGTAQEIYSPSPADRSEVFLALGRGFGRTEEWDNYPGTGRRTAETDNDYWFGDLGLQMTHTSPHHWFATIRLAWTVLAFAPEQELRRDLGLQMTTLLPRGEVGVGVHF